MPTYLQTNYRVVHARFSVAGEVIWEHKKHHSSSPQT